MTVIIALKDQKKGVTYVGGDSLTTYANIVLQLPKENAKVYESRGFVFGTTGAGRIRNILQNLNFGFGKEGPPKNFNLERALIEDLVPMFKDEARKRGLLAEEKNKIPLLHGMVLIAIGTQICALNGDFGVTPIANEYFAVGSGQQVALGALEIATKHSTLTPYMAVKEALKAAAKYKGGVGEPFIILKTKKIAS